MVNEWDVADEALAGASRAQLEFRCGILAMTAADYRERKPDEYVDIKAALQRTADELKRRDDG